MNIVREILHRLGQPDTIKPVPWARGYNLALHLIKGNIDLWISSDYSIPYIASQAGVDLQEIEKTYTIKSVDNYIVFSIQTPDSIVNAWQQTLDHNKKNKTSPIPDTN